MYKLRTWLLLTLGMCLATALSAHIDPNLQRPQPDNQQGNNDQVSFRENCDNARAQLDQDINNVRARLTSGGDVWWDGNDGRYVVPKVPPGVPEVSSLFAGAVWLGGLDPNGNLKLAAQTYGRAGGNFDFWAGPLTPISEDPNDPPQGTTDQTTCAKWDRFFTVTGEEIDLHLENFQRAQEEGRPYDPAEIPSGVRGWPARGNDFFFDINNFELPNTAQGLAGFWDVNGNDIYEPQLGDYPIIEIRGCEDDPQYPDEMNFWIYNDAGNIHAETQGDKIQMEIQVQAFAYASNDELNDMTFQRYKLINRAVEDIEETYFAMWVDPDLGCYTDDYIGCDTLRSLAYVYNADAVDGESGCSCPGGVNTYCEDIPLLGVDYFRGPIKRIFDSDDNVIDSVELGMTSFTYYNNASVPPTPPAGTTDPAVAQQYYNYLRGLWLDGAPFEYGGDGRSEGTEPIAFAFTEPPNDGNGWSMCSQNLPVGDRRTVQASGPFRLQPGAINELIIGAVWVADQDYPCPSIRRLQEADDIAQALFDNCFNVTDGPDAPDVDWIELDREIIAIFTNDTITSNNAYEEYAERGLQIPPLEEDSLYVFEGYKLFQLSGPDVTVADLDNPDKARPVAQVDIKNNITQVFNWSPAAESPIAEPVYIPTEEVNGQDEGIRHTFRIAEDQFATGQNRRLINHKKYYYVAVAYAHNEYEPFNPRTGIGQRLPYLEGRSNIGDGANPFYTVIPRPITNLRLNAEYGDGAVITRVDGIGTGDNFLDLSEESREEIVGSFSGGEFSGEIIYAPGNGPIDVRIFNPLSVTDGEFELRFVDSDLGDNVLENDARWELRSLSDPGAPIIASERTIERLNEQIIAPFGFSISIGQVAEPGTPEAGASNGFIGFDLTYADPNGPQPWFGIVDGFQPGQNFFDADVFNYVRTDAGFPASELDPNQAFTTEGPGFFVPYLLAEYREELLEIPLLPYVTPAWVNNFNGIVQGQMSLDELNNVDIVVTPNKDLWSRCVVIETASQFYRDGAWPTEGDAGMFDLRAAPSVLKEADPATGLPVEGTINEEEPANGMGWFPGYAVDVETGQRLNIFFGENSVYDCETLTAAGLNLFCTYFSDSTGVGGDMMFNPNDQIKIWEDAPEPNIFQYYAGGHHFIYVTNQAYDECKLFQDRLTGFATRKVLAMQDITWTGFVQTLPGEQLLSYEQGLIPNETTLKLRVTNGYAVEIDEDDSEEVDTRTGTGINNYHPAYRFTIEGKEADTELTEAQVESDLDLINVVPNPYYGFSDYEVSQFTTTVKITNLPAKCVVTIYSLDGKFIRQYNRDEVGIVPEGNNRAILESQVLPDLEWDLNNNKSIPIASGVYLIHVSAEGLGERTIKWFGVNRKFDPSGL